MKKLVILLFLLDCTYIHAQNTKSIAVQTPDNITISAQEWGNPKGPEIVFIHGLGGSHLSWKNQYESSLSKEFRILTYDLRGHGDSGKPTEASMYTEGKRWGDELKAVISAAGFKKPTLVAWSLGGVVIVNYLQTYGEKDISGIVLVDAIVGFKPEFFPPGARKLMVSLLSDDLEERSYGIGNFLRACFNKQPNQKEFELMLTYNAMVPLFVQRAVLKAIIEGSEATYKALKLPVLIVYGERDQLVAKPMALYANGLFENSKLKLYPDSGHSPFFEEPEKFNEDLRSFVGEGKSTGLNAHTFSP